MTAFAGGLLLAGIGPLAGAPKTMSAWLVLTGLALTGLGIDAGRRERRAATAVRERDRAEAARVVADERSRELADHAGDVLATLGPDCAIRHVSDGCQELLGLDPAAVMACATNDLVHPGDAATGIAALRRLKVGEDRVTITVRLRNAGGAWRWAEAQLLAVRDGGVLTEIHATVRDVHARTEAERAQADAEVRFRTAFEEAPIGMAIVSIDGRFLQVNRALCAITGRDQEELEGTPVARLRHPEDRDVEAEGPRALGPTPPGTSPGSPSAPRSCATPAACRSTRCCRSRTSPSGGATSPSCSTWPTTTR